MLKEMVREFCNLAASSLLWAVLIFNMCRYYMMQVIICTCRIGTGTCSDLRSLSILFYVDFFIMNPAAQQDKCKMSCRLIIRQMMSCFLRKSSQCTSSVAELPLFKAALAPGSRSRLRLQSNWVGSGSRQKRRLQAAPAIFFFLSS